MTDTMLCLRRAEMSDLDILYEWVNETGVRKSAFNSEQISYVEHKAWFHRMMEDPNQAQYILIQGNEPIGQIRLTFDGSDAEIDYSIAKSARGHGYGKDIIQLVQQQIKENYPSVKRLIGKVKPTNTASLRCFEKSGFKEKYRQLECDLEEMSRIL